MQLLKTFFFLPINPVLVFCCSIWFIGSLGVFFKGDKLHYQDTLIWKWADVRHRKCIQCGVTSHNVRIFLEFLKMEQGVSFEFLPLTFWGKLPVFCLPKWYSDRLSVLKAHFELFLSFIKILWKIMLWFYVAYLHVSPFCFCFFAF